MSAGGSVMPFRRPTVSVVILSYGRPDTLAEALESIVAQEFRDVEIIVIDNRSAKSDRVAEVVRQFPGTRFFPQPKNLGFAAGMNAGLAVATGRFIHLTEDDIILEKNFYDELLSHAISHPLSLSAGVLYQGNSCWSAGAQLDIGRRYIQEPITSSPPTGSAPYAVGMLAGAMIFGRRELFLALKGFRSEFFVYFEDAEFSWRARARGLELWVAPTARAQHRDPGAYRFSSLIEYHKLKNYLAMNLLYMPLLPLTFLVTKFFFYTTIRKAVEGKSLVFLVTIWTRAVVSLPWYLAERSWRRVTGWTV
jgi:GT2 family glycosyltransferase